MHTPPTAVERDIEPRWPALVAVLAVGGLHYALPSSLSLGPDWFLLATIIVLLVPTVLFHRAGRHLLNQVFGYILLSVITIEVIVSLVFLITRLMAHLEPPKELLVSASALWISNVLVFASWYWRLDAGGPNLRDLRGAHTQGAFLFPQMMLDKQLRAEIGAKYWRPGFVDYLFLAFNTSTAFSPTDVPILSRWAKVMMMVQACISLATVVILAARAVNIL